MTLSAAAFVDAAIARGFRYWTGVPDSYLKPFINYVIGHPSLRYVVASNEGDAVAIAAGVDLAGGHAVVMFQNSGLGNAVNPLTSLADTHRIPMLLICSLRGDPARTPDEPQHKLMGEMTTALLDLMGIPWRDFPDTETAVSDALDEAFTWMESEQKPFCLIMRRDGVLPVEAPAPLSPRPLQASLAEARRDAHATRREMLAAAVGSVGPRDVILATTGYTGRELYALGDRPGQLALVGAMGCASSVALGVALVRPELRVIVFDGDGAAFMRLGAMAAIGYERPRNLVHVVLDNAAHESTGSQSTVSRSIDLGAIARACGYQRTIAVDEPGQLEQLLHEETGVLTFVRASIVTGTLERLPRPSIKPPEATQRFRRHVASIPKIP